MQTKRGEIASGSQAWRINGLWLLGTSVSQPPRDAFSGDATAGSAARHPRGSQLPRHWSEQGWYYKSDDGKAIELRRFDFSLWSWHSSVRVCEGKHSADKVSGCFNPGAKKVRSRGGGIGFYSCRISNLLDVFCLYSLPNIIESYSFPSWFKIIFL